jgi:hypothetical protein
MPVLLLLGLCAPAGHPAHQRPSKDVTFHVRLSVPKTDYLLFEPVVVTFELTNPSEQRVLFHLPSIDRGMTTISVVDASGGVRYPVFPPGPVVHGAESPRVVVEPGAVLQNKRVLHYDFADGGSLVFPATGEYQIKGDNIWLDEGDNLRRVITLNSLTIRVVDPKAGDRKASDVFQSGVMARCIHGTQRDKEGMDLCRTIIDRYPKGPYAAYARYALGQYQLTVALQQGRNPDEAARSFQEGVTMLETLLRESPNFPLAAEARYAIAQGYYLKGKHEIQGLPLENLDWLGSLRILGHASGNAETVVGP